MSEPCSRDNMLNIFIRQLSWVRHRTAEDKEHGSWHNLGRCDQSIGCLHYYGTRTSISCPCDRVRDQWIWVRFAGSYRVSSMAYSFFEEYFTRTHKPMVSSQPSRTILRSRWIFFMLHMVFILSELWLVYILTLMFGRGGRPNFSDHRHPVRPTDPLVISLSHKPWGLYCERGFLDHSF